MLHIPHGGFEELEYELVEELPLHLHINGKPYTTLLRTPGEDEALVVGFLFTEGLIKNREDILSLGLEEKRAEVTIRERVKTPSFEKLLERAKKGMGPRPVKKIKAMDMIRCIEEMESCQTLRKATGASHGAMLFSRELKPMVIAEDVGRHNALDKAIGKAILEGVLDRCYFCTLSSRISLEMAKKLAMAGIKGVLAVSKPTSTAARFGKEAGMIMASLTKKGEILLYTNFDAVEI